MDFLIVCFLAVVCLCVVAGIVGRLWDGLEDDWRCARPNPKPLAWLSRKLPAWVLERDRMM